jgi:hypothetical protein
VTWSLSIVSTFYLYCRSPPETSAPYPRWAPLPFTFFRLQLHTLSYIFWFHCNCVRLFKNICEVFSPRCQCILGLLYSTFLRLQYRHRIWHVHPAPSSCQILASNWKIHKVQNTTTTSLSWPNNNASLSVLHPAVGGCLSTTFGEVILVQHFYPE